MVTDAGYIALELLADRLEERHKRRAACSCLARVQSATEAGSAFEPHSAHWRTLDVLVERGLARECGCDLAGQAGIRSIRITNKGLTCFSKRLGKHHPASRRRTFKCLITGERQRIADAGDVFLMPSAHHPALLVRGLSVRGISCRSVDDMGGICRPYAHHPDHSEEGYISDAITLAKMGVVLAGETAEMTAQAWVAYASTFKPNTVTPEMLLEWLTVWGEHADARLDLERVRQLAHEEGRHAELAMLTRSPHGIVQTYAAEQLQRRLDALPKERAAGLVAVLGALNGLWSAAEQVNYWPRPLSPPGHRRCLRAWCVEALRAVGLEVECGDDILLTRGDVRLRLRRDTLAGHTYWRLRWSKGLYGDPGYEHITEDITENPSDLAVATRAIALLDGCTAPVDMSRRVA